ncbi:tRNA/rRNA methyltransferase SpoU [Russula earlei]|uniref:tRNA/rRNA methyltransferase SpoU n=1 Tax=Russula earlei TaxID=71964 RepID=A0ACC0TVA0_9AGAM|nr:tRNA/rRNA methyltransferase SpoU [Russula earlei]
MLSKNEVKYIQSLCHKKQRQEDGVFVVEGPKLTEEIVKSDYKIRKIYAVKDWIEENAAIEPVQLVSEEELQRISNLQAPNKVLAIAEQPAITSKPLWDNTLSIMLDGIQDPGNLGTIIRIADWFGITQVICSMDTVELYNPKVIQGTMGSFIRVTTWYADLEGMLTTAHVPVFGALLEGESIYNSIKPKEGIILVGSEGKGIRPNLLPFITSPVTIPRIGGAESLNAAVAAAIIVSHLKGG